MIHQEISSKVLTIGPDYINNRGGIGAMIGTYSSFYANFKFLPTYRGFKSNIAKSLFFLKQVVVFAKTLWADKDIEIIHIHGSNSGSTIRKYAIFRVAKMFNKKVVYHLNASSYHIFYKNASGPVKRLVNHFMKNVDVLLCVSPWWKSFYSTTFNINHVDIVNNAVIKPTVTTNLSGDIPTVNFIFLGRVGDRKGVFDLLDCIIEMKEELSGKFKLFVGGDGETDKLTSVIADNNLQNLVEYIGWVSGEKKEEMFLKSHVYILPSYNEGLPIAILESMSYGLPIVSTNIGGTPEVLFEGVNGYIFTPGDKARIKEIIREIVNNPADLQRMGKESLNIVKNYFPDAVEKKLVSVYKKLLSPQDSKVLSISQLSNS